MNAYYDGNDECRYCGAHLADPHQPSCPTTDQFGYLSEPDEAEPCPGSFTTRGADPYGTDCDLAPGHAGQHEGLDPFGEGRIRWTGGGQAGGDPLPTRKVEAWDEATGQWVAW